MQRQPPLSEQQSPEEFVLQTVRAIVYSGKLISGRTNEPLSETEKAEYLTRATFYFYHEEMKWSIKKPEGCTTLASAYDVIIRLLKMEEWCSETLKCTVDTICQTPTRDEDEYKLFLEKLRRALLPHGCDPLPIGAHEQNLSEQNLSLIKKVFGHIENNVWGYISGGSSITSPLVKSVISSAVDEIVLAFDGTLKSYNIASGVRAAAMVGGLYLSGTIAYNVVQAARGRKSWRRAGKHCLEEIAAVGSGVVFGIVTSALLAPLTGGISLICGGFVSIAANFGTRELAKKYTGRVFNIPEDEWLEKAYATLDKNQLVENNEISKGYREKSRRFHPDTINSKYPYATEGEKNTYLRRYLKVQAALGMIMAARNEDIDEYENARKHFKKIEEDELLEKKNIDISLKLWAAHHCRGLWTFFAKTQVNFKYPAITNGVLPYEFFEEAEEAVAA